MASFINRISNYKTVFLLLLLASALFMFANIAKLFLPKTSLFFTTSDPTNYYKNYPFERAFGLKNAVVEEEPTVTTSAVVTTLEGLKLKAIFAESGGGFVVIEDAKLSIFVGLNEELKGYKLVQIHSKKAVFTKNSTNYELTLIDNTPAVMAPEAPQTKALKQKNPQTLSRIARKELNRYRNDARLIWDNIGINPITESGQFKEFRVTFVAKGSIFEQLGIMPGDVLKSANGVELDGYASALKLYSEVDKIESLRLEIIRNNQVRELTYEIN